jgi:hypothetical protein
VTIRCPTTNRHTVLLPAELDSGSDRTILAAAVVKDLQLVEVGRFACQAFYSAVMNLPLFLVAIELHEFPPIEVRATLGEREPYFCLGETYSITSASFSMGRGWRWRSADFPLILRQTRKPEGNERTAFTLRDGTNQKTS